MTLNILRLRNITYSATYSKAPYNTHNYAHMSIYTKLGCINFHNMMDYLVSKIIIE